MITSSRKVSSRARIDAGFGAFKAFLMGGWNTDGDKLNKYAGSYLNSNRSACPTNGADCGWGDWAFWTGASYQLTPKLQANAQVAYTARRSSPLPQTPPGVRSRIC
ncbi:hypothetical protein GFPCMMHI_04476 [Ensifer adhaerens]|nr:hypothetical protein [Ensifer adhaerens]